ncbi:MAG: tetratricopeptide repeat protein [Magnetococcus sp. YQC-5]
MNPSRIWMFVLGCLFCWSASPMAMAADTLEAIYALADRKEFDSALKRLNLFLSEHPRDAQARFLKGLILTETKQREQAITVFQQLSKDFPELPEPYNNLAVLYAEQGHFDKAQEALQQAVKNHPNYATAHENLGDIYAKMASQSYARALKLNQGNAALTNKLNKIKMLFAEKSTEKSLESPVPESKSGGITKSPPPVSPPPKAGQDPIPPPVTAADAPQETVRHTTKTNEADPKVIQEVQQAVHAWAAAWSAKNLDQYLAAYSSHFQPFSKAFRTRADWEKNRREIIGRPGAIQVKIMDLQINMLNEKRAQTTFQQNYSSKQYRERSKKTLSLELEQGSWKIVREYADE